MPIEIREVVIKATIALDWENKTVNETNQNIVCLRLPDADSMSAYVKTYFEQRKAKTISFDQSTLSTFLLEWQSFLLK
ncbi:MAG: hypothetical protein ABIN01_17910 [Ferruginibacter sp.]